jgi:hypothetical protein
MSKIPFPKTCTHHRRILFLSLLLLTFVVHIEFIGVRGVFSSMRVPGTPDLQPKLQGVYLCAFFISCMVKES